MAKLFRQIGGVTSLLPTTSWVAPNGLFSTNQRNDDSLYSFTSATSLVGLPSSNLANGYLLVARFEFRDTSNGRHNPSGKIVQISGKGDFVGTPTGGYNRSTVNNKAFVSCFAFINNPSAGATFQFQWKRDADAPTGGTFRASFDVIPLYYSDVGIYSSDTGIQAYGGTTPNQIAITDTVLDGSNIYRTGNIVTVSGDNKRYMVLSSQFYEMQGRRTQRWFGHRYDGSDDGSAKAYAYYRNNANNQVGNHITDLIETNAADRTIELTCYRGDGVANNQGGADIDGTQPIQAEHSLVIIELNDSAEVFKSNNTGASSQNVDLSETTPIDVQGVNVMNFNDSASFTKNDASFVNILKNMDALTGANISAASRNIVSGTRYTGKSAITVNGLEDSNVFHGNYMRGNQGSTDTFGFSCNHIGYVSLSNGNTLGHSVIEDGDSGDCTVQPGWVGFWALNLDTLQAPTINEEGYVKVWTGSAFEWKPLKVWNGSAWEIKPCHYWTGSNWQITNPQTPPFSLVNLYQEGDAADPENETNTVSSNWDDSTFGLSVNSVPVAGDVGSYALEFNNTTIGYGRIYFPAPVVADEFVRLKAIVRREDASGTAEGNGRIGFNPGDGTQEPEAAAGGFGYTDHRQVRKANTSSPKFTVFPNYNDAANQKVLISRMWIQKVINEYQEGDAVDDLNETNTISSNWTGGGSNVPTIVAGGSGSFSNHSDYTAIITSTGGTDGYVEITLDNLVDGGTYEVHVNASLSSSTQGAKMDAIGFSTTQVMNMNETSSWFERWLEGVMNGTSLTLRFYPNSITSGAGNTITFDNLIVVRTA